MRSIFSLITKLLTVVVLASTAQAATPVLVRLGDLAWVGAREGLPRSIGGRVMVPPLAACDLLGLSCQVHGKSMDAVGPLGKLSVELHQGFTELRPLALITGQNLQYDARSGAAVVTVNPTFAGIAQAKGTQPAAWLAIQHDLTGHTVIDIPLKVDIGSIIKGNPTYKITVLGSKLNDVQFTLYSKREKTLTITGNLTPPMTGIKDNNSSVYCHSGACTLPAPRDALWTLAYVNK